MPAGSSDWFRAASVILFAASVEGDPARALPVVVALSTFPEPSEPTGPYALAVWAAWTGLMRFGQVAAARSIFDRLQRADTGLRPPDPAFLGFRSLIRGWDQRWGVGTPGAALAYARESRAAFEEAADPLGRMAAAWTVGWHLLEAGAYVAAERALREAVAHVVRMELPMFEGMVSLFLATVLHRLGNRDEALEILRPILESRDWAVAAGARTEIAAIHLSRGAPTAAAQEMTEVKQPIGMYIEGIRAMTRTALGQHREAIETARASLAKRPVGATVDHSRMWLALAESLHAIGDTDAAREAIRTARDRLTTFAASFDEPELRASYLEIAEHQRTLELARQWGI